MSRTLPLLLLAVAATAACTHTVDERPRPAPDAEAVFERNVRRAANLYQENLYDAAERRYLAALEAGRGWPPDDARLLAARVALALVYRGQQRFKDAERELLDVIPLLERTAGDTSVPVGDALNDLGVVYLEQQRYAEAASVLLTAGRIRASRFGESHPLSAVTMQNFAAALKGLHEYRDALGAYQRAYEIFRAAGPEWDWRSATVQNQLGLLHRAMGDDRRAEAAHLSAIDITRRINSTRNPNLAIYSLDLATLYAEQGRYQEAAIRFQTALEMFEKTTGKSSPQVRETLSAYGDMLESMGRTEAAAEVRGRAAALARDR